MVVDYAYIVVDYGDCHLVFRILFIVFNLFLIKPIVYEWGGGVGWATAGEESFTLSLR